MVIVLQTGLRRTDTDMTRGSVLGQLVAFSVPLLIGNIFQQLYNTVDSVVVGNFVGKEALAAGALALGAKVSVSDRPGYAPLVNSPELAQAVGEAMRALLGADRVKITNEWTTGCTDMGDVSCIMPVLHPHIAGAAGKSHGDDYHLVDREMACVNSAKGQLLLMALLMENGAARAKQVVERYHAPYESKAAYFATLDAILRDRELIEYHEDTAQIRL